MLENGPMVRIEVHHDYTSTDVQMPFAGSPWRGSLLFRGNCWTRRSPFTVNQYTWIVPEKRSEAHHSGGLDSKSLQLFLDI